MDFAVASPEAGTSIHFLLGYRPRNSVLCLLRAAHDRSRNAHKGTSVYCKHVGDLLRASVHLN